MGEVVEVWRTSGRLEETQRLLVIEGAGRV